MTVELTLPPPCPGCSGACLWYRVPESARLTLATNQALSVGTRVALSLPERQLLLGAVVVYGLPLVAVLTGAAAGAAVFGSDGAAAAAAGAAFAGSLWVAAAARRGIERATLRRLTVGPVA